MYTFTALLCLLSASAVHSYVTNNGTSNYVTYQVGGANTRVIISAPHGGTLKPISVPDRPANGCYNSTELECVYISSGCNSPQDMDKCDVKSQFSDQNTQLLANELADSLQEEFGGADADRPHVITCELHRSKVDVNRDLGEAAFGNPKAETAWSEYHQFIDDAKMAATAGGFRVLYVDVHGQSASTYNMIGMLLPKSGKNGISKAVLPDRLAQYSSLMQLHIDSGVSMEELVRGSSSIGGLMEPDFNMIPAPNKKTAGSSSYYIGGYSLRRHTGWEISGFQVEAYRSIRVDPTERKRFADKLANAIKFWVDHYL